MNQSIKRILTVVFGLLVVSLAGIARAQSVPSILKVNIPFDFKVGDKILPAGEYSLVESLQNFLELRDERGRFVAHTFTRGLESSSMSTSSRLRFYVADGQHVLAEVWREGDQRGEQLYEAKPGSMVSPNGQAALQTAPKGRQP